MKKNFKSLTSLKNDNNTIVESFDSNGPVQVKQLIEKYFKLKAGLKATSIRTITSWVNNWIKPYFDDVYVEDIDKEIILIWFNELKEHLSSSSVKHVTNCFVEILEVGVDFFNLDYNPAKNFKFNVSVRREPVNFWTREEFEEFIDKVEDPHLKLFYKVLFNTGMRSGEIRGLQFQDINLSTGEVRINKNLQDVNGGTIYQTPKTASSNRTIFLPKKILEELKDYIKTIGSYNKEDRIFYLTQYKYRKPIEVICEKYGLKPIKLHEFRHSFATEMISKGTPINFVSKWLGHSKISTTLDLYTQVSDKGNKFILEILNNA